MLYIRCRTHPCLLCLLSRQRKDKDLSTFTEVARVPKGMEWLWHPQIVSLYNRILRQCEINAITREAACGALQNITAGDKRVSGLVVPYRGTVTLGYLQAVGTAASHAGFEPTRFPAETLQGKVDRCSHWSESEQWKTSLSNDLYGPSFQRVFKQKKYSDIRVYGLGFNVNALFSCLQENPTS